MERSPTSASFKQVFGTLRRAHVRYLVVGGVVVVLHGHLRTTAHLDLVVQLTPENVEVAAQALAGLELRPRAPVQIPAVSSTITADSSCCGGCD